MSRLDFPAALIPLHVRKICAVLDEAGHRAWIVGGCVRDILASQLRGAAPRARGDWDLATDAHPEAVQKLFRKVLPTGLQHGTVTVMMGGVGYEVTTLRGEATYSDGRRPDAVHFVDDIAADLARRDFTINAIAVDVRSGTLVDPFGGKDDLQAGLLRAVGTAAERFAEDGLRVLRAARFVASLEVELEPATAAAIEPSLDSYRKVSSERIHDEWWKAMKAQRPSRAFRVMADHGILAITAPELLELRRRRVPGCARGSFEVALETIDRFDAPAPKRLAGLLHELGRNDDGSRDADAGARTTDALLARLKASNDDRSALTSLVRHWDFDLKLEGAALRRWLATVTPTVAPTLVGLRRARLGSVDDGVAPAIDAFAERLRATTAANPPLRTKDLAVNGKALMTELGLTPGRHLGELLTALLDDCLDEPTLNTRERLLDRARERLAAS